MLLNGNPEIRQSGGCYSSGDTSQFSGSEKMMLSRKLICSWLAVPQYQFTRAHMNNCSTLLYMIEPFCQRFAVYFQHNFGDAGTHFAGDVLFAAFDVPRSSASVAELATARVNSRITSSFLRRCSSDILICASFQV